MAEQNQNTVQLNVLGNIYNNIKKGLSLGKDLIMLQGSARCFAPGTKVRMYDGTLKNVEDISYFDKVAKIGGDGYNFVINKHSGTDKMYRVKQDGGIDYIVNSKHELSLLIDNKHIVDISVEDYLELNDEQKNAVKGFSVKDKHICPNSIRVESIGVGEYYGFTLTGDHHFLLEDGTVVKNSGKTYNTLIYIILECLQNPIRETKIKDPVTGRNMIKTDPLRVSIVRQSLPVIKRSVYEDFKTIMISMGQWEDRRMNKTDYIYTFQNGATIEFFSADDEQKLRGPWRHILYINEANEIYYYSFSMLRQRTYEYVIVDYNPSFTEEHWLFPLMKDERSYHFISTYKDNIFLPAPAVREIESYQTTNPALWQIFGKGEFAIVEGLVFPKENWDIIEDDAFPEWLGEEYIGIDWGFTCFGGDTLIATSDGDKSIKDVKDGDLVLTRNGYKRVVKAINKGIRLTVEREIEINGQTKRFVATNNHKFYSNGKWKKYEELTVRDNLCVLSNLTEKCSKDTQTGNTQTIISTSGKKMEFTNLADCIERFGNTTMVQYLMGMIYIIKTIILSIITSTIYSLLQTQSTIKFMEFLKNTTKNIQNTIEKSHIRKAIGMLVENLQLTIYNLIQRCVNGAERNLSRLMFIRDSATKNAITNGSTNLQTISLMGYAKCVGKNLRETNILNKRLAQQNARINYCGIKDIKTISEREEVVYDLSIEDTHEYFANGVLVHNCDPTVFIGVIINGDDIYARVLHYQTGMKTKDIADALMPYAGNYKYCDIDNRLVTELEDAGIPLLTMTKKNSESIMSGIRLMNQRKIHITVSSTELIKEMRNYVYKKDRHDSYQTNLKPIDKFNHCIDALRYVVYAECGGINGDEYEDIPLSKFELGLFM